MSHLPAPLDAWLIADGPHRISWPSAPRSVPTDDFWPRVDTNLARRDLPCWLGRSLWAAIILGGLAIGAGIATAIERATRR